ncbi:MAG: Gldg family protein [Clostridia bacterium]|nr:Gldg family protein [Clostridia bacterium]
MKMKTGMGKKLRYGGVTAALTAAIIAIIIIVNIIFSALAQKNLWYSDLTPELVFTLSENCVTLLRDGDSEFENSTSPIKKIDEFRAAAKAENPDAKDEDIMINIIFCNDELTWTEDTAQRYVLETAKQLQKEFPDYINIEYVDIIRNPTAVTKYGSGVTTTSVIIECGSEFRVRALKAFYVFDEDDSETPWAYNGEKILAASILAVTRADTPVVCITTNHGEQLPGESFLLTLVNAGYDILPIDLSTDEIPADCRLIIVSSPDTDFMVADGITEYDEIEKLDIFLDGSSSLMVFMDPTLTTRLTNFEDYLEEWGVKFDRVNMGDGTYEPYRIQDNSQALDANGYTILGDYVDYGLGGEITEELAEMNRKIAFPNVMSISYSDQVTMTALMDEDETTYLGDYGYLNVNSAYREIYDIFVSSDDAVAWVGQQTDPVETAKNGNNFKLMTVTVEDDYVQESNYTSTNEASYVIATGCSEFALDEMLHGQYGNNMFLEYTLRIIAHEPVPVGLTFKPFGDYTIDTVTTAEATQYTVVFTVVPLILSLGIGIFVIVRRKNR